MSASGDNTVTGTSANDHLNGGSGNDTLLGGAGNDFLNGGSGNDILNGQSGSDRVDGGSGNDVLIYQMSENAGATDIYDGGSGIDTLRLVLTSSQLQSAAVQADIANFQTFLNNNTLPNGQANNREFRFTAFDLTVSKIENLQIEIIGGANQAPTAANDTASAAEAGGTNNGTPGVNPTGNVLTNDTDPDAGDTKTVSAIGGSAANVGQAVSGNFGTLTLNADGTYNYLVDNANTTVQGLQGTTNTLTETFTYTMRDAAGATSSATLTITITGTNDAPTVSAAVTGGGAEGSGDATVNLLDFASDVDNGAVLHVVNVVWDEVPGNMPAGFTLVGNTIVVDTNSLAYNAMAVGETFATHFTYDVVDQFGASIVQHATVTITGTNDAPAITGATAGSVQEDTTLSTMGQLNAGDPDHNAQDTWTVVGGSAAHAADYHFLVDNLKIIRNGGTIFEDTFGDGAAPPSSPNFTNGNPHTYGTTGAFGEAGGRAILDGTLAGPAIGVGTPDEFVGHFATVLTNIDPADATRGLKIGDDFQVEGRFDLILPDDTREAYGIRLTDRLVGGPGTPPDQPGDDAIELVVRRAVDGIVRVQLIETDFVADTRTIIQSRALNVGTNDQIVLRLEHDNATPGAVNASFDLLTGGVVTSTVTFSAIGQIFGTEDPGPADNENWTRAQIVVYTPEEADSTLNGTYGSLVINQAGLWTYNLANSQTNVQALAQDDQVTDTFIVHVVDEHGASDTETVTITVNGTNDAPVITGGTTTGAVQEDGVQQAVGTLNAIDVDHGATRTWKVVGGSTPALFADYHFQIDNFAVIKNGSAIYTDGFDNNVPPPSGVLFSNGMPGSYSMSLANTVTESGGRVNMDGGFGIPFAIGTGLGHFVTLNTNTSNSNTPADLDLGLKFDDDFTVEGRFDLISPDIGESYRIRVGDSVGPALGDDTIQLAVTRDAAGVLRVTMNELDFVANVSPFISSVVLNPAAGDDQIVLRLTHDADNVGVITGSYDLLDNGVVTFTGSLPGFGQIFGTETPGNTSDDELFTRAEFGAGDNFAIKSALNGVYGTLTINQSGNWSYNLDNSRPATQNLADDQIAFDVFTVHVMDEHGAFDTETITITVTGNDDAPSPVVSLTPASVEGNEGDALDFVFTRTGGDLSQSLTINYVVNDGPPAGGATRADGDFSFVSGMQTLTFDPFESMATISVQTYADSNLEGDESFPVLLALGLDYTIDPVNNGSTGVIHDVFGYAFTTIDYAGATSTIAQDINDAGQVVGQATVAGQLIGWESNGGVFGPAISFAPNTSANTINDSGVVGGYYEPVPSTPRFGFLESGGVKTQDVNHTPGISTTVDGINDAGDFVGHSLGHTPGRTFSGYINDGGVVTFLDAPGATSTTANGINDSGDVVGTYDGHGFIYDRDTLAFTTIDVPFAINTTAADINDAGQVVGWFTDGGGDTHGFVYDHGVFATIDNPLGANGTFVRGINDAGDIAGWYTDDLGVNHGFTAAFMLV